MASRAVCSDVSVALRATLQYTRLLSWTARPSWAAADELIVQVCEDRDDDVRDSSLLKAQIVELRKRDAALCQEVKATQDQLKGFN